MKYRVEAIQTVKGGGLLYVDVAFLDDQGGLLHRNDFVMQMAATQHRYTEYTGEGKERRPVLASYEEYDTDVKQQILENIKGYLDRVDVAKGKEDRRDPGISTEDTDPLGLRAAPGVAELVGAEIPVVAIPS